MANLFFRLTLKEAPRSRHACNSLREAVKTAKAMAPVGTREIRIFKYPGHEKYAYRYGNEYSPVNANFWEKHLLCDQRWCVYR